MIRPSFFDFLRKSYLVWGFDDELVNLSLIALDLSLWLVGAVGALIVSAVLVFRNWDSYKLPMRLLPLDILAIVLLIDLNIKSLSNVTVADLFMKVEAISFTALLAIILFVPLLWKLSHAERKPSAR